MKYHIYKIVEKSGCEFEDGADTTSYETTFVTVSDEELDSFLENMADCAGYQDYSYSLHYTKIACVDYNDFENFCKSVNSIGISEVKENETQKCICC